MVGRWPTPRSICSTCGASAERLYTMRYAGWRRWCLEREVPVSLRGKHLKTASLLNDPAVAIPLEIFMKSNPGLVANDVKAHLERIIFPPLAKPATALVSRLSDAILKSVLDATRRVCDAAARELYLFRLYLIMSFPHSSPSLALYHPSHSLSWSVLHVTYALSR